MNMKWVIVGIVLFAVFVGGMMYLAKQDIKAPSDAEVIFVSYAEELGLDTEQFLADIKSEVVDNRVAEDIAAGNAFHINSTPTLMMDDQKLSFRTYGDLEDLVTARIAEQKEPLEVPTDTHIKGASTPKVIITEFSDFECPACHTMTPIIANLLTQFPDDLAVIYKHFPLTRIHPQAMNAAHAAEAAANQGKFWEMHDLLFERQADWK